MEPKIHYPIYKIPTPVPDQSSPCPHPTCWRSILILRYDSYLLQLGFHPVVVVGKLVQVQEWDSYIGKEKQYTKNEKPRNTQNM
jgi:hypothetical protein